MMIFFKVNKSFVKTRLICKLMLHYNKVVIIVYDKFNCEFSFSVFFFKIKFHFNI